MRCPKCGYISFDNVDECLKCKKNIKSASDFIKGTTFNATAPAFLHIRSFSESDDDEDTIDLFEDEIDTAPNGGYVDRDLEVLIEEDDASAAEDDDVFELQDDAGEPPGDEGEDREIEIDFSKFESGVQKDEEEDVLLDEPDKDDGEIELNIPEELNDISDLAPPTPKAPLVEPEPAIVPQAAASMESDEIDLDSLDFDLGFDDDVPAKSSKKVVEDDDSMLSLDEIDFSDSLGLDIEQEKASAPSKDINMDDDLDFDLDLGGLSIHDDK